LLGVESQIYAPARAAEVVDFWFGESGSDQWFGGGAAFDRQVAQRLGPWHAQACAGACDAWRSGPQGCLALILLFDQVPRHLYRGEARAFQWDPAARKLCNAVLAQGFDRALDPAARLFVYLPLEHSESLSDQERAVALIAGLGNENWSDYARRHRDIIARFGRFPHRNAALGRASTAAERAFLTEPRSAF